MKELYHLARCWAIEPDFLSNLSNMTKEYQAGLSLLNDGQLQKTSFVKIRGDIAIISLQGIITPRMDIFTYFMGGTPLDCLARDFQTAIDDDNIKGILFDIDSPGGVAVGPAEMAEIIFKARQIKPVWSYVGRNCCSAAYWLAAATEKIIAHQSALLGSIGVVTTVPVQESPDQSGYKNIEIVSSNAKNKRPDPRTPEGINEICRELNELESQFINAVANFRDLTIDQIKNDFGQGGVLIGAKAVQIKMADMQTAGINTNNLSQEQTRLGRAISILENRHRSLANIQAAKAQNMANRAAYRSQIMDVTALGFTLFGILKPAIAFESAMADVKKVVDFDSPQQFKQMGKDIKELSEKIPLSVEGLASIVAAGGQLGIPKQHLTQFAETAAKMSVAMDITADEAGRAMAKMSNVLSMPIEDMGKVGDVINYLSNNIAATGAEIVEVNLRAGAMGKSFGLSYNEVSALAGTFIALGKSPEIAGTAINMMTSRLKLLPVQTGAVRKSFNQLGISMKSYRKLIEQGKGQEALLTVLEALKKVQGIKRAEIMKNIFGEEAQRHVNGLVESLDSYKKNIALVSNETNYAGSMQKEFAARSATTENNIQLLKNRLNVLAVNFGTVLLPAVNNVIAVFSKVTGVVATFAEKHPVLAKNIGLAITGLISLKLAVFGIGYGFTFLNGGLLTVMGIFSQARTIFALTRLGLFTLIPAIKAVGMAFLSNPIGLVIAGLAFAVIKYWDPISKGFSKIAAKFSILKDMAAVAWQKISEFAQKVKNAFKESWLGKAWNYVFGGDEEDAQKRNDKKTVFKKNTILYEMAARQEKAEQNLPHNSLGETVKDMSNIPSGENQNAVEIVPAKISPNHANNVNISAPITVYASPGVSAEDVAKQINLKLNEREREAARRQRGANYD